MLSAYRIIIDITLRKCTFSSTLFYPIQSGPAVCMMEIILFYDVNNVDDCHFLQTGFNWLFLFSSNIASYWQLINGIVVQMTKQMFWQYKRCKI